MEVQPQTPPRHECNKRAGRGGSPNRLSYACDNARWPEAISMGLRLTSKFQAPTSKETSTSKYQTEHRCLSLVGVWRLALGASLELGCWDLELLMPCLTPGAPRRWPRPGRRASAGLSRNGISRGRCRCRCDEGDEFRVALRDHVLEGNEFQGRRVDGIA